MDQNQPEHLFDLHIDQQSSSYLNDTAKWAKFLAILGFVWCGFIVIMGVFAGSVFAMMISRFSTYGAAEVPVPASSGFAFTLIYVAVAVVSFFPCLYLFRFATRLKRALSSNDQELLSASLRNQRLYFRYLGILAIIFLGLFVLYMILLVIFLAVAPR
ncbi:MAG: hypothetical protein C5B59_05225 [Bacteroidetes bacterium]|nr:MAG: hypothetical protein C5B59_05225 [Bacteroidota bacterium]